MVGGVAFVALCVCFWIYLRRHRGALGSKEKDTHAIEPFISASSYPDANETLLAPWRPGSATPFVEGGARTYIGPSGLAEKHTRQASPGHDRLAHDVQELRQQVASLRAASVSAGSRSALDDAPLAPFPGPSGMLASEADSDLRRELASLRGEIAWLTVETEGTRPSDPPPAYV